MWFVRKKKYTEMEQSRERWKMLADRWMSHAEDANKLAYEWEKVAVSCQEDNKRLVAHEEEMLAKMRELEAKLDFVMRQRDYYYGLLEDTSEVEDK